MRRPPKKHHWIPVSLVACLAASLAGSLSPATAAPSTYEPTWASVDQHPPAPEWFQDAKFGIYFHWGAFSVPAYDNEWYPRNMYISGSAANTHHRNTYGEPSAWPYHNFINGANNKAGQFVKFAPKLKSQGGNFDPQEWAQLFADSGAKFAGPVAEHHDGFSMWDSQVNDWNSVDKGPGLDLMREFRDAFRAKNMKFLVAMHHAYNFTGFYDHVPTQSTTSLKRLYGQLGSTAENQLWYDKLKEVVDQAQPDILWQDFNLDEVSEAQRLAFLAYYYNQANAWGKEVVATYKDGFNNKGEVFDYERGGPADLQTPYWLTDDAISSSSWSYTNGIRYYSSAAMLHSLIDRVSKNGNMLLNVSPTVDGTIPQGQRDVLAAIGTHLRRNAESIYSTRAWITYGEGPTQMGGGSFVTPRAGTAQDIRYTRNKANTTLYATVLGWPGNGAQVNLGALSSGKADLSTLSKVELIGSSAGTYVNLPTRAQDSSGLRITMPSTQPYSALAYVIKLTFNGQIPSAGVSARVFGDVNHAGSGANLKLGSYTTAQLSAAGVTNDSISSIRLAPGYQMTAYAGDNFTGTSWTFTGSVSDLRNTAGANDAISSLRLTFNPNTYFTVRNVTNGLAVDGGGNVASGSNVKLWTADGSTNLQWQLVDLGTGYYRLVNRTNGMVADGWGNTTVGSPVRQATWNGGNSQQWSVTDVGGGNYRITNRATGLVLDSGGNVPSGSVLMQYTSGSSTNLLWRVVPVS